MDGLLKCDLCGHGAPAHDGSGCERVECGCRANREQVVASGIEAAKEEIRRMWDRPADGVSGGA